MRKLIVTGSVAALMLLGTGAAFAGNGGGNGGPNGGAGNYGVCNAYSHNSQQAKDHGQAFLNLENAAEAYENQQGGPGANDTEDAADQAADVMNYCNANFPKP